MNQTAHAVAMTSLWVPGHIVDKALGLAPGGHRQKARRGAIPTRKVRKQNEYLLSAFGGEERLEIARQVVHHKARPSPIDPHAQAGAVLARQWLEDQAVAAEERRLQKEKSLAAFARLREDKRRAAEARFAVLKLWWAFRKVSGAKLRPGTGVFASDFEAGRMEVPAWVREEMTRDGRATLTYEKLHRWEVSYQELGLLGLVRAYHNPRKGQTSVPPTMQKLVEAMVLHNPRIKVPRIVDALRARFPGQKLPHLSSLERWLTAWKAENAARLLHALNPDDFRSRMQVAFGKADEQVVRANQRWEMDSTPADVLLRDGKRHTILGVIDVYTRRLKLLVSRTSSAAAVCGVLRRALLDWGVPELVKTDNGSDYVSHRVEQVLNALEVERRLCPPFTPEAKPFIEKALGTFSHGIVELLAGYVGHDVAERKEIEARKSFAERLMKRGETVEIRLDAEELQRVCDRWVEAMYHQSPHEGLGGKTPAEVFRAWTEPLRRISDERALDILLMPAPDRNGLRKIGKKGVWVEGRQYLHASFGDHMGADVRVKLDDGDLGRAFLFLAKSRQFLCVAECPEWTGISRAEVSAHARAKQKALQKEWKKTQRQLLRDLRPEDLAEDILAHRESLIGNVAEFPKASEAYSTPSLEEAARAADALDAISEGDGAGQEQEPADFPEIQVPTAEVPEGSNVVALPLFFPEPTDALEYYERVARQRPLTPHELEHLREIHRDSGAVRRLMRLGETEHLLAQG